MEAFYRFASGGSTVQQFAKDVYLKGHLTSQISTVVNSLVQESRSLNISPGQKNHLLVPGSIPLSDSTSPFVSQLCDLLEAALLHGLKEKLSLSKMTAAVLGPRSPVHTRGSRVKTTDQTSIECLDFWPIVQILCHNQVSENLLRLSHVYTDIGRCRAWLRLILNDSLFGSYMEALTNDTSLLHGFYRSNAYLRDSEHVELLLNSLRQLDSLSFQLNYDDGSLNTWTTTTLKLIGIQIIEDPAPVMPAMEALDEMNHHSDFRRSYETSASKNRNMRRSQSTLANKSTESSISKRERSESIDSHVSINGSSDSNSVVVDGCHVRRNSLASSITNISLSQSSSQSTKSNRKNSKGSSRGERVSSRPVTPTINLISESGSHSIQLEAQSPPLAVPCPRSRLIRSSNRRRSVQSPSEDIPTTPPSSNTSVNKRTGWTSSPPKPDDQTVTPSDFTTVFNKYIESTEVILSSTPDIREFTFTPPSSRPMGLRQKPPAIDTYSPNADSSNIHRDSSKFNLSQSMRRTKLEAKEEQVSNLMKDFEVIPKSIVLDNSEPDTQQFLTQLSKLPFETGLDQQDYKCKSCGRPIGLIYGKYRVCKFDGHLYCIDCHSNEESIIPSKVINNWDFNRYPVSKRNKQLLESTESDALLDLKITSAILYQVTQEMKIVLDLRTQLFFLHAYLFTCTEPVALQLRKMVWPREHLFEHIHLYSLVDLIEVSKGSLVATLKKAINFARKHVLSCRLCSEKGFICEFCKSEQIIYPFDTSTTVRCDSGCKAVYHSSCVSGSKILPDFCPRCIRIARRKKLDQM